MKPLISVIVPVYNVANYLEKCVKSICNQTYQNLEIILVDDGSTDESKHICDSLIKCDRRIRVVHQKNGGLAAARNSGIDIAEGTYIGFVDGDDSIEPDMYERLYQLLVQKEASIAVCGFIREYKDKNVYVRYPEECFDMENAFAQLVKYNQVGGNSACNKLYKMELFDGIRYPEGRIWEDLLTTYKLYEKADKIACTSEAYYHYFQRDSSIIHTVTKSNISKVEAGYERALDIENRYFELAMELFDGVANECMHNCIAMSIQHDSVMENFKQWFQVGTDCYEKIRLNMPMTNKRKLIYFLFFKKTKLFLTSVRIIPFIR